MSLPDSAPVPARALNLGLETHDFGDGFQIGFNSFLEQAVITMGDRSIGIFESVAR